MITIFIGAAIFLYVLARLLGMWGVKIGILMMWDVLALVAGFLSYISGLLFHEMWVFYVVATGLGLKLLSLHFELFNEIASTAGAKARDSKQKNISAMEHQTKQILAERSGKPWPPESVTFKESGGYVELCEYLQLTGQRIPNDAADCYKRHQELFIKQRCGNELKQLQYKKVQDNLARAKAGQALIVTIADQCKQTMSGDEYLKMLNDFIAAHPDQSTEESLAELQKMALAKQQRHVKQWNDSIGSG